MSMEREPFSYTCPCGAVHQPKSPWVAAHWNEELVAICDKCERQNVIRSGVVLNAKTVKALREGKKEATP